MHIQKCGCLKKFPPLPLFQEDNLIPSSHVKKLGDDKDPVLLPESFIHSPLMKSPCDKAWKQCMQRNYSWHIPWAIDFLVLGSPLRCTIIISHLIMCVHMLSVCIARISSLNLMIQCFKCRLFLLNKISFSGNFKAC